jgi:hypothetical protein
LNRVSDYKGKIEVTDDNVRDLVVPSDLENDDNIVGIDFTDNFSVDDVMEVVDTAMSECNDRSPTDDQEANTAADDAAEVIGGGNEACAEELGGEDEDDSSSEASDTPLAQIVVAGAFTGITKSTGLADEDSMTAWHCAVNELPEDLVISLEYLSNLKLCESVPIAWCADTNQVCEMQSFVPAFLTRVTKHMWEVTDVDDLIIQNLDWKGDEGIENMMGIYIQHPVKRFMAIAQLLAVSPNRKALRKRAAENLVRSASKMKSNAIKKAGMAHFDVGNVVKIALVDVDKAKTDSQNLTGVIVNINWTTMMA